MTKTKTRAGEIAVCVDAGEFSKCLAHVAAIIERRNTIPVLGCVHLKADKSGLTITGTNLDQWASVRVDSETGGTDGEASIEAARLLEMVKRMSGPVQISVAAGAAKLQAGRTRGEIPTLSAEDFPSLAFSSDAASWDFDAAPLARALGSVVYACSKEETQYYLRGIHLKPVKKGLRLEATDGYRAAIAVLSEGVPAGLAFESVILPRASAFNAIGFCERAGETVTLAIDGDKLRLVSPRESFTTKLIDGTFPDVERVFQSGKGVRHTLPAAELARAIDFSMACASDFTRAVRLAPEKGRLVCSSRLESNYSETAIEAPGVSDADSFVVNGRFFLEALAPFKDGDVTFESFGPGMPIRFEDGPHGLRQIIMVFRG